MSKTRTGWELQERNFTAVLLALPFAALVFVFVFPVLVIFAMSFSDGTGFSTAAYGKLFQPVYFRLLWFTFKLSFVVTLACVVIAYPVAFLLAHMKSAVNSFLAVALLVSLWLSFLARTFAWIIILQRNGVVNNVLVSTGIVSEPINLLYNQTGVYIGMTHVMLPLMIITLIPALRAIDLDYIRAAMSMGCSPWQAWRRVYLPLSMPGVVAGSMLVFTLSFGFFITPSVLGGGRVPTIILAIRDQIQVLADMNLASATSVVILIVCLTILVIYDRLVGVDKMFQRGS